MMSFARWILIMLTILATLHKIKGQSGAGWQTIERNNTYIHVVREQLTQANAISGCHRWFSGSLLHMPTPRELFTEMKAIDVEGVFWIQDIKDPDFDEGCLTISKENQKTSVRAVNCEEQYYSLCKSVADPALLLDNADFETILQELVVRKNETAKDFRSKNSIWDSRLSAHVVGGSGIVFMVISAVIIGLCDLPFLRFCVYCLFRETNTSSRGK